MSSDSRLRSILLVGALVGAILGAGAAYLLSVAPSDEETDEPITAKEIVGLTSVAAILFRRLDKLRRQI
jgi:gas vesicle protein